MWYYIFRNQPQRWHFRWPASAIKEARDIFHLSAWRWTHKNASLPLKQPPFQLFGWTFPRSRYFPLGIYLSVFLGVLLDTTSSWSPSFERYASKNWSTGHYQGYWGRKRVVSRLFRCSGHHRRNMLCCSKPGNYAPHNDLRNECTSICVELKWVELQVQREQGSEHLHPVDVLVPGLGSPDRTWLLCGAYSATVLQLR